MNIFLIDFLKLTVFILLVKNVKCEEIIQPEVLSVINNMTKDLNADYASSSVDLKNLVGLEQRIVKSLLDYAESTEHILKYIKSYVTDFNLGEENASFNISEFENFRLQENVAKNPLLSYRMIARMALKLPELESLIETSATDFENEMKTLRSEFPFPKVKHFAASIVSTIRLQQIYQIEVEEFAKGKFLNTNTKSGLRPNDCYLLGHHAMRKKLYTTGIDFMDTAIRMYKRERDHNETLLAYFQEKLDNAIETHDKDFLEKKWITEENPFFFNTSLKDITFTRRERMRFDLTVINTTNMDRVSNLAVSEAFGELCNGNSFISEEDRASLLCFYYDRGDPFFIIGPMKVEILNEFPPVLQFYDVLSDTEMNNIKKYAEPKMRRARVASDVGIEGTEDSHRTSSSSWLSDHVPGDPFNYINVRIEHIVGLVVNKPNASEQLQIGNYPPGGFYTPHYDAVHEPILSHTLDKREFELGDRIATFMFYLSDVELGGWTAFPLLGITAEPIKGSAIFWYNLNKDFSINRLMLHGGCPVLYGEKWVANKWIRANDNLFKRQCGANENDIYFDLDTIDFP